MRGSYGASPVAKIFLAKFIFSPTCFMMIVLISLSLAYGDSGHPEKAFGSDKGEGTDNHRDLFDIGGQVRLRGDFVENQNLSDFSFSPDTDNEQLTSRARLGLSITPSDDLTVFAQGQFYGRNNHNDYSKANLYQMFVEIARTIGLPLKLKVGRQDFSYGSAFFLGSNDFYEGLTWDGVKLRLMPQERLWVDLLGARYVNLNKNTSQWKPALYGAYASYSLQEEAEADFYFFYHKGGFKFFHTDLPDSPRWFTLGARLSGEAKGGFDYEIEPVYQFGRIDNPDRGGRERISAYGGHAEAGYSIDSKYNPRLFLAYAFGSGDNDTGDRKYREFHGNVYNDNYLVGDTSVIADLSGLTVGSARASGMHILTGGFSLDLSPKLNLNLDHHYFLADKAPGGVSKKLGREVNLVLTYEPFHDINVIAGANRFFTQDFFRDAAESGKDVTYFYIQTQIEF